MNFIKMAIMAIAALPAVAAACVDTRSGNVCERYEDVVQKANGYQLMLARDYNSGAAPENGWFGYGWSTAFEARLTVMPDGSVLVRDPQDRKPDRYAPVGKENLVEEDGLTAGLPTEADREAIALDFGAWLRSSPLRLSAIARSSREKPAGGKELKPGARVPSLKCSNAAVTRIAAGYRRTTCQGSIDYFDLAGRLVLHEEDNYRVAIHYAGDRPDRIEDSEGQMLLLKWDAAGHIVEARTGKEAPVATYRYDDSGNLVAASAQSERRYNYDAAHKMTRVESADQVTEMQYDAQGRIAAVVSPDGTKHAYEYRPDPEQPDLHFRVVHTSYDGDGRTPVSEGEYLLRRDAQGIAHLALLIKTAGGAREEILLDAHERITFVQKSDGTFSRFTYHPAFGKMASVTTQEGRMEYRYDRAGNLIRATDDTGRSVSLAYDRNKHIARMVETDKTRHTRRELAFAYNADGKPVKISMAGKGTILVEYDAQGEITHVESKQGSRMALAVTEAFQSLLSLIKPVGAVNLCI